MNYCRPTEGANVAVLMAVGKVHVEQQGSVRPMAVVGAGQVLFVPISYLDMIRSAL